MHGCPPWLIAMQCYAKQTGLLHVINEVLAEFFPDFYVNTTLKKCDKFMTV